MVVEISQKPITARRLAPVFKALGDDNRAAIFELLKNRCCDSGPCCEGTEESLNRTVSEIAKEFDLALSTVSHHLKELRGAGLITCVRQGQRVHCSVDFEMLETLREFLKVER